LKGVMFGQNMILVRGADTTLGVGESFEVDLRS
jgi:hypothetical protein